MTALKAAKAERATPERTLGLFDGTNTTEMIGATHTDELVIALCGPIGSPLHQVSNALKDALTTSFGYDKCKLIKLSDFISEHAPAIGVTIPPSYTDGFERITRQIDAGNKLREKHGAGILAELAINEIRLDRERYKVENEHSRYESRRVCHIIDSIKNKEELALLRLVYREMLYVVGVFAPLELREANLKAKDVAVGNVYRLIDRDSGEESEGGQTVRETFPNADFFLRIDNGTDANLQRRVERFLHLILGTKVITPTAQESAMYAAAMAATNSACLSRQVGAAVTGQDGALLSVGWNDVPRFRGGLYAADPESDPNGDKDQRCFNRDGGKCFNDEEKDRLADEIVRALGDVVPQERMAAARTAIKGSSKLRGLIEFSRAIHAEMHAIINAGQAAGGRMRDGKLFVTTYPCHSCARHIVAAGIREVYYIEPYRKSLAIKLHGDAMSEKEGDVEKVRILAYDGVAPGRYLGLFKVPQDSRKKNGKLIRIGLQDASPRIEKSMEAFPVLESLVVKSLQGKNLLPTTEKSDDVRPPSPPAEL
ncbi:anti-phage dCTP deaminase [Burkholderia glumae]|uniref:anti-phage dCTP deaminase n=1 Tax=Burkholderia glumae TaxID=337 RepID=UPI003B9BE613